MAAAAPRGIITTVSDLTANEIRLGDDILVALRQPNRQPLPLNTSTRARLWAYVFFNWDSSNAAHHPGPIPERKLADTAIVIGKISIAEPETPGSPIPEHRQVGAPRLFRLVVMNMVPETNTLHIQYQHVDEKGSLVPTTRAELDEGDAFMAPALHKYDTKEITRVHSHNVKLTTYWVRCRVLALVKDMPGHYQLPADAPPENMGELIQLSLVSDILRKTL